jgi:hypothetical protein
MEAVWVGGNQLETVRTVWAWVEVVKAAKARIAKDK